MDNVEPYAPPPRDTWACWISIGALVLAILWVRGYAPSFEAGGGAESSTQIHFTKIDAAREDVVSAIAPTMGGVLVGTRGHSLLDIETGVASASAIGQTLPSHITAILATEIGIYVGAQAPSGTRDRGLFLLSPPAMTAGVAQAQPIMLPGSGGSGEVTALTRSLGRLWVGTKNGLYGMDAAGWYTYRPPSRFGAPLDGLAITALYADAHGTLWIGTENGLYETSGGEVFHHAKSNEGLPDDQILSISGDETGLVVVGTERGLGLHRDRTWVKEGSLTGKVAAVLVMGQGEGRTIWAGEDDKLWVKTATAPFRQVAPVKDAANGLTDSHVTALAAGVDGLYVGTEHGLFHRDDSSEHPAQGPTPPAPSASAAAR